MLASTVYWLPRILLIVRALAGDSTITNDLDLPLDFDPPDLAAFSLESAVFDLVFFLPMLIFGQFAMAGVVGRMAVLPYWD